MLLRFVSWIIPLGMMVQGTGIVFSQNYPNKHIRMVTCEVGGGSDMVTRLVAHGLTASVGQQVIVENRPCGVIPGQVVVKAVPDGYTLLVSGSPLWLSPLLRENVSYDPVKDFAPITLLAVSPTVLTVHPSLPVKSVEQLIALAKSRPGELNYAAAAIGSPNHLAAELFKAMTGVDVVGVPFRGTGPSLTALMSGEVHLAFANAAAMMPHVKSGKLRGLAVTSKRPSALAPGLPTLAATVPGYESASIYGTFAPATPPQPVVKLLNQEIVRFLHQPEVKEKFFKAGLEVVGSTPDELGATIKAEMVRMGKVIKDAGIRAQ